MNKHLRFMAALAIVSSILGVLSLAPMVFGVVGLGSPLFPLATAVAFIAFLSGPLLLLAAGLGLIFSWGPRIFVLAAFFVLLAFAGFQLFWSRPEHGLIVDWMVMSVALVLMAAALRRPWLCAVVGGTWQGLLLGFGVIWTVGYYLFSSSLIQFSIRGPIILLLGCLFASGTAILAFLWRDGEAKIETSSQSG
jgi:hypothetical protein